MAQHGHGDADDADERHNGRLPRYLATQWRRVFGLNLSRITDDLFVGGQFAAAQWPDIAQLGINSVLSLQAEHHDSFSGAPPMRALRIPVDDFHAPSLAQLEDACTFLHAAHAAGLVTLVHCHAGVGRAPLTAAAYLMTRGHTSDTALALLRGARPIVSLNGTQLARLEEWQHVLREAR
jgi:hypothetical protein